MKVINTARTQHAVIWPKGDKPDQYGQETYGDYRQILVRWSFGTKIQAQTEKETGETYTATILLGEDVREGDYIMLGQLGDVTDSIVPKNNIGAYKIQRFRKTPNLKGTIFVRRAFV